MTLLCALAGHEPDGREAYNGGFHFSHCRRCRRDMFRSSGTWEIVPDGHRVAWKSGRHSHSLEPDLSAALPVLHHQANLPAVRPSFTSWSRQLAQILRARRIKEEAPSDGAEAERQVKEPYPRLIVIAALIGAGLQMLFGFGSGRRETAQSY
jgi:hypothetical protein